MISETDFEFAETEWSNAQRAREHADRPVVAAKLTGPIANREYTAPCPRFDRA